jgi:putative transposase
LALLVMPGRVTLAGISRWAGKGGSYPTIQRLFSQALPWAMRFWVFCRQYVYRSDEVSLLAGDEVVVTKAGKHTYGLGRFFSSVDGKPVPGLAFFTCSLVSVRARRAFPVRVEQVVRSATEQASRTACAAAMQPPGPTIKRRRGRPQGSKNTPKADVTLTPELQPIPGMLGAILKRIAGFIPLTYLVLDGHVGHHHALQMARQHTLHLISKRRCDAALYLPYAGPYAGRGPSRTYGCKVDDGHMPEPYLKETTMAGPIQTCWYQARLLHKAFAPPRNVVIIAKIHVHTQAQAHVFLFSSDLQRAYAPLVDDYGLRFQSECNFRDAKQDWGLEDFMHVTPTGVTNAANLSLFMVNVSYRLQAEVRLREPDDSILDLKADGRGDTYVEETINMLPQMPEPVLWRQILDKVAC